jgi:seryl-tRNA synthetase
MFVRSMRSGLQNAVPMDRSRFLAGALVIAALAGWGSFAYALLSAQGQVRELRTERDQAKAERDQLKQAVGDLSQVNSKLMSARAEYTKTVEAWAQARAQLGKTSLELSVLAKRLDQERERVTQTGSIKQPERVKRATQ